MPRGTDLSLDLTIEYPDFILNAKCTVKGGSLLTLLGPSGCGKTTLLRAIAGLEPLTEGKIFLGGTDITRTPTEGRNIGFVFQDYALFPHLNVFENIAYGPKTKNWPKPDIRDRIKDMLDLAGLSGYEKRRVHELSGGEQQRVALARALAADPALLLLDEPLSALDAATRTELRKKISEIQKELAVTTVYVTHDQREALGISDAIAVMNNGRVVQEDTPEDLYHRPKSVFAARFIGDANIIGGSPNLFFRPEHCSLSPPDDGDALRFEGPLSLKEYLGKEYLGEIRERKSGSVIRFYLPGDSSVSIGTTVTLFVGKKDVKELLE